MEPLTEDEIIYAIGVMNDLVDKGMLNAGSLRPTEIGLARYAILKAQGYEIPTERLKLAVTEINRMCMEYWNGL